MDVYIEFDHIDMWSQIDKGSEAIWIICEETYDVKKSNTNRFHSCIFLYLMESFDLFVPL